MKAKTIFQLILFLSAIFIIAGCGEPGVKKPVKANSAGINTVSHKLSVNDMHSDLSILWSAIKELHPGYGLYTSTDDLKKAYDKTYSSIDVPLYENEFIARVYPFLCQLRCGHTQLEHSAGYKSPAGIVAARLPFEVLVRHGRAWITTHQTEKLSTGDEIIRMNNIPVSEIIGHGSDLYCGDGYNETFKEVFLSEYDGFEDACNKYFHWPGPYQIILRTKGGELKNVRLDSAVSDNSLQTKGDKVIDNYANWTSAKNTGNLSLRFLNNSATALLTITPFAYSDTLAYKEAFKLIHQKGIKNLIIDLRHNTGGDIRIASQLLSYLADSSFNIIKDAKSRIPNPALSNFAKYFDTARTASFNLGYKPGNKEGIWYHIDVRPAFGQLYGKMPIAKTDHFNGNLLVLIDGATFSSGALFTVAVKAQCRKAKFIGRETSGAEEGCNGMTIQRLTLPNTHIVVDFPWMRVVSVAKKSAFGRGIMPDFEVDYKPGDIVDKRDIDLEKAVSIIKQYKRP